MVDVLDLFGTVEIADETYRMNVSGLQRLCHETGEVDGIPIRMVPLEMYRHGTFTVKDDIETSSCQLPGATHPYCAAANQSSDLSRHNAIIDSVNRSPTLQSSAFDDYDIARYWSHP